MNNRVMIRVAFDGLLFSDQKIGIVNYIHYIIMEFIKRDDPNFSITVYIDEKYINRFSNDSKNVKFSPIKINSRIQRFSKQYLLAFELKDKYDILISPDYPRTLFLNQHTRSIVVIPDVSIHKRRYDYTFFRYLSKKIGYYWAIYKADAILTYSKSVANDIREFYPSLHKDKIATIWVGISPQFFDHTLIEQDRIVSVKGVYKLPDNFFLFVGTIMPRKNLIGVLKAFEIVYKRIPQDLVVVGAKGWKYDEIFTFLDKSLIKNRVHFVGFVDDNDLPAIYKQAQFLIFPSFDEGFGIPIVEAFSVGCPVITSNCSSMKEIAEGYSILVDPNSEIQIASAIESLCTRQEEIDRYRILSLKASERFSWHTTAEQTLRLIQDVFPDR